MSSDVVKKEHKLGCYCQGHTGHNNNTICKCLTTSNQAWRNVKSLFNGDASHLKASCARLFIYFASSKQNWKSNELKFVHCVGNHSEHFCSAFSFTNQFIHNTITYHPIKAIQVHQIYVLIKDSPTYTHQFKASFSQYQPHENTCQSLDLLNFQLPFQLSQSIYNYQAFLSNKVLQSK